MAHSCRVCRALQNSRWGVRNPRHSTILIYLVTCNWLLNCTTGVFRSFCCLVLSPLTRGLCFTLKCTKTVWLPSSALPETPKLVSRGGHSGNGKDGEKAGKEDGHPRFFKRGCAPANQFKEINTLKGTDVNWLHFVIHV